MMLLVIDRKTSHLTCLHDLCDRLSLESSNLDLCENLIVINVYLRASTTEQDATRAKNAVDEFLSGYGKSADDYFIENASGSKLERPELGKLLHSAQEGDVIVVEQVDRLTRLSANDWETLKGLISSKGISLVSIDLPTSHAALTQSNDESLTGAILSTVNNMLLDILAITARKDYEDRLLKSPSDGKD